MFTLNGIQTVEAISKKFISSLPSGKPLSEVISVAHTLCPELKTSVQANESTFRSRKSRDKGSVGKIVEFYLFGQLPNCDPNPDLAWGADIKATHFKANKQGHFNAKERVTITNCGSTGKPETLLSVANATSLESCKYYPKIQKGVMFVFEHTGGKYPDIETNLGKRMLCVFPYDVSALDQTITDQLNTDFRDIQEKIRAGAVSQKGQKFLHIHPHGSKNSTTRAFGFTNRFVTQLASIQTGRPLTVKGRSIFIENQHFM